MVVDCFDVCFWGHSVTGFEPPTSGPIDTNGSYWKIKLVLENWIEIAQNVIK
jgi:hypothetical protein